MTDTNNNMTNTNTNMTNTNTDTESEYDSDDDWDEVYAADDMTMKGDQCVRLTMAGGGSHAWSYVQHKDTQDCFIWHHPFENEPELLVGKKLVFRRSECQTEYIKVFDEADDIPEDDDDWEYAVWQYSYYEQL